MATSSRITLHAVQVAQRHGQRQFRSLSLQSSSGLLYRSQGVLSTEDHPVKRFDGFKCYFGSTSTSPTHAQADSNVGCTKSQLGKPDLGASEFSFSATTPEASDATGANDVNEKNPVDLHRELRSVPDEYRGKNSDGTGNCPPTTDDRQFFIPNDAFEPAGLLQTHRSSAQNENKTRKKMKARRQGTKNQVTATKSLDDLAEKYENGGLSERYPKKIKSTKRMKKIRHQFEPKKEKKVPTSDWLLVTNIPMMSQLSDILPGLTKIVEFELQKGIIDLDALEGAGTPDDKNRERSEYPLWKPPVSIPTFAFVSNDADATLPPHMVLEARIHLNYRARPVGWFLRFPNRSVVNAILNHLEKANLHHSKRSIITKRSGEKVRLEKHLKQKRYRWRDRLWKEVLGTVGHEADGKDARSKGYELDLLKGRQGRMETMGEDEISDDEENGTISAESEYSLSSGPSLPSHLMNPILQKDDDNDGYHLLTCGMETLNVREFKPREFDDTMPSDEEDGNEDNSWAQHFFHLGPSLDLSDSVIRVDIDGQDKPSIDEIKYFFRAYDMKGIYRVETTSDDNAENPATTCVPNIYAESAESIGWTLPPKVDDGAFLPPQSNVDFLIHGFGYMKFDERGDNVNSHPLLSASAKRPYKSSFLVRLDSPAEARMAVREKLGAEFMGSRMIISQFPKQDLSR